MFGSAPAEVIKILKEQKVSFNNHKKCVPVEVRNQFNTFILAYISVLVLHRTIFADRRIAMQYSFPTLPVCYKLMSGAHCEKQLRKDNIYNATIILAKSCTFVVQELNFFAKIQLTEILGRQKYFWILQCPLH